MRRPEYIDVSRRQPIDDVLTFSIIGAFFEVYNALGFGFLERIYVQALEIELRLRGHRVAREVPVLVHYKGFDLSGQRLDMVIDETVVIETPASSAMSRWVGRDDLG